MAKGNSDRNHYETGSTQILKGSSQLGGQPFGSEDKVEDYNLVSMVDSSKNKLFRGAGGSVNIRAMSPSCGGSVKS
jgi:hypothetical protein